MVSRSEIAHLSKRIDALVLALAPAASLPPCPEIRLSINAVHGNTPRERADIAAYLERCSVRKERVRFEVELAFDDEASATGNSHADVP